MIHTRGWDTRGWDTLKKKKRKENAKSERFSNERREKKKGVREGEADREDNGNIEILDHRYDDVVRNFGKEPISS